MAFPTTGILDTFSRANGSLGANWGTPSLFGFASCTIFSNAVVTTNGTDGYAHWLQGTYLNCESWATFTSDTFVYVSSRISSPNTANVDGYFYRAQQATNSVDLYRVIDNSATALETGVAVTFTTPATIGLSTRNIGINIVLDCYFNGTLVHTETDANAINAFPTLAAAGFIGLGLVGAGDSLTRSIDTFGGGEINSETTNTVGLGGWGAGW